MLKIGKLDSDVLQKIVLDKIRYKRREVKTGSGDRRRLCGSRLRQI